MRVFRVLKPSLILGIKAETFKSTWLLNYIYIIYYINYNGIILVYKPFLPSRNWKYAEPKPVTSYKLFPTDVPC